MPPLDLRRVAPNYPVIAEFINNNEPFYVTNHHTPPKDYQIYELYGDEDDSIMYSSSGYTSSQQVASSKHHFTSMKISEDDKPLKKLSQK